MPEEEDVDNIEDAEDIEMEDGENPPDEDEVAGEGAGEGDGEDDGEGNQIISKFLYLLKQNRGILIDLSFQNRSKITFLI